LYLPFLRAAIWENLARAEQTIREGEALTYEEVDIDCDGYVELWVHSNAFSAIVSPARGGAIEELTRFHDRTNLADTLTRRREAYHVSSQQEDTPSPGAAQEGSSLGPSPPQESRGGAATSTAIASKVLEGAPSIHALEHGLRLDELPPIDRDDRAIFIERVLRGDVTQQAYASGTYAPLASAAKIAMSYTVQASAGRLEIRLRSPDGRLEKTITFTDDGSVRASLVWDPASFGESDRFTTELSLGREHELEPTGHAEVWSHPIETVAKSERGLDRTLQGVSYLVRWPVGLGKGDVGIPARSSDLE